MMHHLMVPTVVLAIALSIPALASEKNGGPSAVQNFDDCYRLAWVRGVHIELGELPGWYEECSAGNIPFNSGNPATTVRRSLG